MPRRSLRSRSLRRVKVRTPGGRVVIHYERRPGGFPRCAWCGSRLHGIPRGRLSGLPRSQRRVERIYGGYLCHRCLSTSLSSSVASEWATA